MLKTIQNAASAIKNQQLQVASTANNIANINTTGYKADRPADFSEAMRQAVAHIGITTSPAADTPPRVGVATRIIMLSNKDYSQGPLQQTGRELDLAIDGEGFFKLTDPNNPQRVLYSRAGAFQMDAEGNLFNQAGYHLAQLDLPEHTKELRITEDGKIFADTQPDQPIGQLTITCFENPGSLKPVGLNMLAASEDTVEKTENASPGKVMQGYLEQSNVHLVDEMAKLITAQRAHSLEARALATADEMWGISNSLRK